MNHVLGLFPSLDGVGGIERAGRSAWGAIAGDECFAISFDGSKPKAIAQTLARKWPVRTILVWHIGMLKLLPFARAGEARVVLVLHGIEAWRPVSCAVAKLLDRVDLFLTVSDFTWRRFLEFHPERRSATHVTVPLGLGSPVEKSVVAPSSVPSVLMLSRAMLSESYKGHGAVVAEWKRVVVSVPSARLRIVGPSDMREDLLALAEKNGVAQAVEITGMVSEDEKLRHLEESRCMALPSAGEGFGLVYLEAMRLGRPCLVSTLDAGREVVGSTGLAVNPANGEELAAALVRLLTPGSEWDAWSASSRQRYEANFTEGHFHERLLAALA